MSFGTTETTTDVHAARSTSFWRGRTSQRSTPPVSPIEQEAPTSKAAADRSRAASAAYTYSNTHNGLGISALPPARLQTRRSWIDSKAPVLDIADISVESPSPISPADFAGKLPWREARDRIRELQKTFDNTINRTQSEDGTSSVASTTQTSRTSADSGATSSTITTPAASNTSTASQTRSRSSHIESNPSTPSSHSRSPSPPPKGPAADIVEEAINGAGTWKSTVLRKRPATKRKGTSQRSNDLNTENEKAQSSDEHAKGHSYRRSLLSSKSTTAIAGLFKSSISENGSPPGSKSGSQLEVPRLPPASFSTDKLQLPSLESPLASPVHSSPSPRLLVAERMSPGGLSSPKLTDELWSVFRNLDSDYAKFASKSLTFKANVVRASLLPFLRTYATHPSNRNLKLEDLERRTNVLNKWWTGLLELLHGPNNQSVSGTDRPAILDGISGIMDRPEWRPSQSPFCPLDERPKAAVSPALSPAVLPLNPSKTSLASSGSDFLAESVLHNVQNIFIQNLTAQMVFVVDKMSLRNASGSLVNFCGKACAYAFVFVPGMADVLVRLWDSHIEPLQRILQGHEIGRYQDMSAAANTLTPKFPPALHELGFTSLMKYMRKLRTSPPLPVGAASIPWWGHWIERWSGRESDLFFVFVKYFHILAADFLPSTVTKKERLCAPGVLLVHAQLLVNLDATIHRQVLPNQQDSAAGGPGHTFDEMLADPDAVASTLPIPPTNASRLMADKRVVMLIRDFLSERATDHPAAQQLFAESFSDLLQATARGCALFDHAACYTLLDFLEETLVPLARFDRNKEGKGRVINMGFWITVWKKMISSQNTMTEIRLYSFLYTVWNSVVCESDWKAYVCSHFILDPEIFESRFTHWCPTVRAYFMRLLCWRVARQDGEYSSVDVSILETLQERLWACWSTYGSLQVQAERNGAPSLPTNPCNPIPSRRLRIVRTDTVAVSAVNPSRAYLPVDDMFLSKDSTRNAPSALKQYSTLSEVSLDVRSASPVSNPDTDADQRSGGFGGMIRSLIGTKNRSKSRPPTRTESRLSSASTVSERPNGGIMRSASGDFPVHAASASTSSLSLPTSTNHHHASVEILPLHPHQQPRKFHFKFALEYHPTAKPYPAMRLSPPRLPAPAQHFLTTHTPKSHMPASSAPRSAKATGASKAQGKYYGHALAEWVVVLAECQSFFERRKNEGVSANGGVETPGLGVEVFRRPGGV